MELKARSLRELGRAWCAALRPGTRAGRGLLSAAVFAFATFASAEGDDHVIEKVGKGQIDWTTKAVLATGSGPPDQRQPSIAAVRLNAEKAAKAAAYKNIVDTLRAMRLSADVRGAERLSDTQTRAQVEGLVEGCKVVDTRYFSDSGVDVVVECPLDGALAATLAPPQTFEPFPATGEKKYSGLIIDATGVAVSPILAPALKGPTGVLYSQERVKPAFLRRYGVIAYFKNLDQAKASALVGTSPLVIKASGVEDDKTSLKLSESEVAKLDGVNLGFLAEGRVAVVLGKK